MSSSESRVTFELDEPSAELNVIDGRFHVIGRGIGTSSFVLGPGVYKARASAAGASVEAFFAVTGEGAPVTVQLPAIPFRSALPLARTATSREYHQHAVSVAGQQPPRDVGLGTGAALLLSVRDPGSTCFEQQGAAEAIKSRYRRSFAGFSLRGARRAEPLPLMSVGKLEPDSGYLVAHLQLEPGYYVLTYEAFQGAAVDMPVFARAGLQTQLFFYLDVPGDLAQPGVADVRDRAVLFAPLQRRFHPQDPALRQSEIARRAYSARRFVLAKSLLEGFLDTHRAAPMLGMFAGQLALQAPNGVDRDGTRGLLEATLTALEAQLGAAFPDLVAMRLALDPNARGSVEQPPLLRASWQLLQHAGERVELAPALSEQLSRTINVGTWLSWKPAAESGVALSSSNEHAAPDVFLTGLKSALPSDLVRGLSAWIKPDALLLQLRRGSDDLGEARDKVTEFLQRYGRGAPGTAQRPDPLLALIQDVIKSPWWEAAFRWLDEHGADSPLLANLTGLQATLLASLKLARDRFGKHKSFELEDLQALVSGLHVSHEVIERSLTDLVELIVRSELVDAIPP